MTRMATDKMSAITGRFNNLTRTTTLAMSKFAATVPEAALPVT